MQVLCQVSQIHFCISKNIYTQCTLLTGNVVIAGRELFMSDDTLDDSDVKFLEAGQFVAKYHKQNNSMQRFAHLDVNLS